MFPSAPLNNEYVEFMGANAGYGQLAGLVGMANVPRKVEVGVDVTLLGCTTPGAAGVLLFGKKGVGWALTYDDPNLASLTFNGQVQTIRSTTTKTAVVGGAYASRVRLYAKDDAATLKGYENGILQATATWTTALGANPLTTDAAAIVFAKDGSTYTSVRLHEAWVRIDGIVVFHVRPKLLHTGLTAIPDLSGKGNDMNLLGGEGAGWALGTVWERDSAFSGSEVVG